MIKHFQPAKLRGLVAVRAEGDPLALITTLNTDWQAFKDAQATTDAELQAKFDDVVTTEKLSRVDASITTLTTALDDANARIAAATAHL